MIVREPVYQQVNEALRGRLASGEFAPGRQFLTEREISTQYDVSRVTANKALSNLVSEGILEFRKGVGTFVLAAGMEYDLRTLVSFEDKARQARKKPSTLVLRFDPDAPATPRIREALRVPSGAPLAFMERVRLADDLPVILERRYVLRSFTPGLSARDLEGSFYALLTDRYRVEVTGADETIRAVNLRAKEAGLLETRPGSAALAVTAVGYVRASAPLWWERTLYRGDAYEFLNRLGPVRTPCPARGAFRKPGEED
jgi:GntR family transcriptional regulator